MRSPDLHLPPAAALALGAAAAAALPLAPLAAAADGYAHAPFRDHPVALAQAAAIERLSARARALSAASGPPEALIEGAGEIRETDLPLFLASLRRASPEAADALEGAVAALLDRAEAGGPVAPAADALLREAERARGALFPNGHGARPAFGAALAAALLLSEGGVADAYEEAVEGEVGAFAFGRAVLARVEELWDGLRLANDPAAGDVDAALARLGALFPAPAPRERLPSDPEEAEAHAQALVGRLETIADADLYPGRDLGGALVVAREVAGAGCDALEAGEPDLGAERIAVAARHYGETLGATLGVLAPAAHGEVEAALGRLPGDPASCAALRSALDRAGRALPPAAAP